MALLTTNSSVSLSSCSRVLISQLRPFMGGDFYVMGVVIHLTDINVFTKVEKNQGTSRGLVVTEDNRLVLEEESVVEKSVFSFVIADQPMSSIEFKFWGDFDSAVKLQDTLKIGAAIKIVKPNVVSKLRNSDSANFSPSVFSDNQLLFSSSTLISLAPSSFQSQALPLMTIAPSFDYFTLYDVIMGQDDLQNCAVNVLAVVAQVKQPKTTFSERLNREICRLEMTLCDELLNRLTVVVWSRSLIAYITSKAPLGSVVLLCPVRLKKDAYRGPSLVASTLTKSILTVDPNLDDARLIRSAVEASNIVSLIQDMIKNEEAANGTDRPQIPAPNLDIITDVYNVSELLDILSDQHNDELTMPMYGKAFVFVTKFAIDLLNRMPVIKICSLCRSWIKRIEQVFHDSPQNQDFCDRCATSVATEKIYWVRGCLSDHTGSVDCKVSSKVCAELLGFSPEEFAKLSLADRSELKCNVLLEYFTVYFSVFTTKSGKRALSLLSVIPEVAESQ